MAQSKAILYVEVNAKVVFYAIIACDLLICIYMSADVMSFVHMKYYMYWNQSVANPADILAFTGAPIIQRFYLYFK